MHGEVQEEDAEGADERVEQEATPGESADRGGTPDGGGRGHATYFQSFFKDYPCADKTNAGDNICRNI